MNLKSFVEGKEFSTGSGLPEGDTNLDVGRVQVSEDEYEGKIRYKLVDGDKVYFVPKTVMKGIQQVVAEGKKTARVTRQGLTMNDTSYTVVGV